MRLGFASLALLVVLGAGREASAQTLPQQKGFALDRFDPSERGSEWFVADSLDIRGHKRFAAGGAVGAWAYNPLVVYDIDGNYQSSIVEHQIFAHPGASVVLWDRMRAAFSLPIALYQTGDGAVARSKAYRAPGSAFGDLRLTGDARLFGKHGDLITLAAGGRIYVPTGSRENYTSDGTFRLTPRAMASGDISLFTYSAELAFAYRPLTEKFERNPLGSQWLATAAAGVRVLDKKLVVGPEIYGSTINDTRSFLKRRGTPLEWLIGAHYTVSDLRFGAGVGTGLTRGWGTPALRAFLSAEWAPAYVDKKRAAPPPPPIADRDGDGIPDSEDACPDTRGIRTNDAKTNGCPEQEPVVVAPGCPDPKTMPDPKTGCPSDRDGDGIFDDVDACPDVPGLPNTDPLANGCPPDRDGDGIDDKEDACPDAPGPADPDPKRNGCPLARIENGEIKIVEQVRFKTNSAEILRDSDMVLVAVATMIKAHPEFTKLRIEGHTDNRGKDERNRQLSYERAVAVQKWLVASGLDAKLFEAKGYGNVRPIDKNDTEEGRQNNRRVEFHIVTKSQ